ncbi:peptidylprolyl isomerase [Paenibacillus sp. Soil787]|uniref:peptidylprolyl isomerase n=1 Tax=Paenibacillus sp. Soil787 TaxID=1736411 RepID=UPI00070333DF|nr:hypothetical protein [Paenibacillus sp. Soil787]KRF18377.1 hypothetical protein ASG93_09940 [Paenibacillus sp. Soil787]
MIWACDTTNPKHWPEQMWADDYKRMREIGFNCTSRLESGQTSDIFEFGGAYYIIKLLEREDRGFKDFESVKNDVREQYLDSKYEDTVSEWARQAEVTINHNVYDRLKVR